MILAEADNLTTLGGLCGLGIAIIVHKIISDIRAKPREDAKLGNLEAQSKALVDNNDISRAVLEAIRENGEYQRRYSKFGKKNAKKINKKLGLIHEDVLIVQTQTKRKDK